MTALTVDVAPERCVGAGQCVVAAPEVFDQRVDDGVVVLVDPIPPTGAHDGVRRAALLCPAAAIRLSETDPFTRRPS